MIAIAKTIFGVAALASAGALTLVEPEAPAGAPEPAPILIPTINVNGKAANRLPTVEAASADIVARIRMAHGLTDTVLGQTAPHQPIPVIFAGPEVASTADSADIAVAPRTDRD